MINKSCFIRFACRLIVASAATASAAVSAGQQTGVITYVSADQITAGGVGTLAVSGAAPSNKPSCASSADTRWAINIASSKAANQYLYSLAVNALGGGWRVTVTGTGACSTVPSLEDVAYIEVSK